MLLPLPSKANGGTPAEPVRQIIYGKELVYWPGNHRYQWGGQHVPSVTGITDTVGKPGLVQWAADEAVDHIEAEIQDIAGVSHERFKDVCRMARTAHERKRDKASDFGTLVHQYCTDVFAAGHQLPLPDHPEIRRLCEGFLEWWSEHTIYTIGAERMVMSEKMMYAGRTDFYGRIDGTLGCLDLKTGNVVDRKRGDCYPNVWLQLAGYELALSEELKHNEPTARFVLHLDKKTGRCTQYRKPIIESHTHSWIALVLFTQRWRKMQSKKAA